MVNISNALNVHNFGTALSYSFYFPYAAIGITILFFGIAAIRTKHGDPAVKNGLIAALVGDLLIWLLFPLVMPIGLVLAVFILTVVSFAVDIGFKHK